MIGLDRTKKEVWIAATHDEEGRQITPPRAFRYDTLVIAVGSVTNDFGTPGASQYAVPLEIVLGRTLGSATVALIQGSIVFLVCLAAGFRPVHPLLLPMALLFMALIAIMCTAIGTAVGSVLQDMQGFQLIMNFIVLPLFFFSSALFPVPDLPGPVWLVVRLNPLSYGVDGLRGALNGGFAFGAATDFAVLSGLAAILLAIGAWPFSKIEA